MFVVEFTFKWVREIIDTNWKTKINEFRFVPVNRFEETTNFSNFKRH